MKNSLQKGFLVSLVVLIILTLVGTTIAAASNPGILSNVAPSLLTIPKDSISVVNTETGKITLSTDGWGNNTFSSVESGFLRVDKPSAGATVRKAYLMSATTGFTGYALASGDVLLNGTDVFPWDLATSSNIGSNNYWKNVTSIVKPIVDAAPAGIVNIPIAEANGRTANIDGEALAVIFDDPSQTTDNTVALLFGAQTTTGDNFSVLLDKPANFTDPNFGIGFGLGISFGFQVPFNGEQFSNITVNGNLVSASAGGQDDGAGLNGALITVGGIGDLPNVIQPPDCAIAPRCDKERYQLSPPFVNNGDTNILVNTINPSNDDNIFFAWFNITSSTAIVGEGILLSPASATNPVGGTHTVTAKVQDNNGNLIVDKIVTFTVVSGPNAGQTGTGTTNASGIATFTYTSNGNAGTDVIEASFVDAQGKIIISNQVTKEWISGPSPSFTATKDFRFTDVNFTATPAILGGLLPHTDSNYSVNYVLKPKDGTVSSTNPGQLYGVITVNGTGAQNMTIIDTFGTQFVVNPPHIDGGVEVLRVNTTSGNAVVITDTQVTSSTVTATGPVKLTINLTTPLGADENLMVYVKFQTALKGLTPDFSDFVNTADVSVNDSPLTAIATIKFV